MISSIVGLIVAPAALLNNMREEKAARDAQPKLSKEEKKAARLQWEMENPSYLQQKFGDTRRPEGMSVTVTDRGAFLDFEVGFSRVVEVAQEAISSIEQAMAPAVVMEATLESELVNFLAGESWHDEIGWQGLWAEAEVQGADWLTEHSAVLAQVAGMFKDSPPQVAGMGRRWIVVCRYAGIDASVAKDMLKGSGPSTLSGVFTPES